MPIMNFDLQDGQPPVSFSLKTEDCERMMAFMAECTEYRKKAEEEKKHRIMVQKALMFWLPMVPAGPDHITQRTGDDAMLLMGYEGDDEPSAEKLGWITWATSQQLNVIVEAINGYYADLDARKHGGVAQDKAFHKIEQALDMHWVQGASLKEKGK